nr:hypothetical protein CFP56_16873 [Quercus suber]
MRDGQSSSGRLKRSIRGFVQARRAPPFQQPDIPCRPQDGHAAASHKRSLERQARHRGPEESRPSSPGQGGGDRFENQPTLPRSICQRSVPCHLVRKRENQNLARASPTTCDVGGGEKVQKRPRATGRTGGERREKVGGEDNEMGVDATSGVIFADWGRGRVPGGRKPVLMHYLALFPADLVHANRCRAVKKDLPSDG